MSLLAGPGREGWLSVTKLLCGVGKLDTSQYGFASPQRLGEIDQNETHQTD